MSDIKKIVLILILSIFAAPLHYLYDYNTVKIRKNKDWTTIDYKGLEIQTTKGISRDIKVKKVREYLPKVDAECEFIKIIEN